MNEAILREAKYGFIAGMIEGSLASVFVKKSARGQTHIVLKIRTLPHFAPAVSLWLRDYDEEARASEHTPLWVCFMDAAACTVLARAYDYLKSDRRREQARLAFRYSRTLRKTGVGLTDEEKAERATIRGKLKELNSMTAVRA